MNLDRLILTTDQIAEIRRISRDNAASPFEHMLKGRLMYDPMFIMEFSRKLDEAKDGAAPDWCARRSGRGYRAEPPSETRTRELIQQQLAEWKRTLVRDRVVENIRKIKLSIIPKLP